MVAGVTDDVAMDHWQAILDSAPTRYSFAQGCQDAAQDVYDLFDGLGLAPQYHYYDGSYPPNVIGTLPGLVHPDEVVIVIEVAGPSAKRIIPPGNLAGGAYLRQLVCGTYGEACAC